METLRARIEDLLELQDEPALDVAFHGLALGPRGTYAQVLLLELS